jgi:hypothetical protein
MCIICRVLLLEKRARRDSNPRQPDLFLFLIVKSPVLYLAELRALASSYAAAHSII